MFNKTNNNKVKILIGNEPLSVAVKVKFCCIEVD